MKVIFAKCIKNIEPQNDILTDLVIGKYYLVENIEMDRWYTDVIINNKKYNSVQFEYFDEFMKSIDIYQNYKKIMEIEIIEENKPIEKLDVVKAVENNYYVLDKINELIDTVNELKKEGNK